MAVAMVNKNMRFIRAKLGLNQSDFGELIGVRRSMVSFYEIRNYEPRYDVLAVVSRLARVTIDELTGIDFECSNYRYLDFRRTYQMQRRG